MGITQVMKWRIRDIIDLEYFFYQDTLSQSAENKHSLHERDRNIFLDSVMPAVKENEPPDRQFIIKTWLNRRREAEKAQTAVLPGEGVESLLASLRLIFLVAGLVLGAASGASFSHLYRRQPGKRPGLSLCFCPFPTASTAASVSSFRLPTFQEIASHRLAALYLYQQIRAQDDSLGQKPGGAKKCRRTSACRRNSPLAPWSVKPAPMACSFSCRSLF